jgi:hypothetical protein
MVDSFVQGGAVAEHEAINAYAMELLLEVVNSGRSVDRRFWQEKNFAFSLPEGVSTPALHDGRYTRAVNMVQAAIHDFQEPAHIQANCRTGVCKIREVASFSGGTAWRFAQDHAVASPEIVELGTKFLGVIGGTKEMPADATYASKKLRDYRHLMVSIDNMNKAKAKQRVKELVEEGRFEDADRVEMTPAKSVEDWDFIHGSIAKYLDNVEDQLGLQARHDFVLALALASYTHRPQSGDISDAAFTNKAVWPYFMAAMRYYGLASEINGDRVELGSLDVVCVRCGRTHTFQGMRGLAEFVHDGRICKACQNELAAEQV